MEILRVENIEQTYQTKNGEVTALRDVSFSMNSGDFYSLVGPSGCGKSTLLSIIAGLLPPSGGRVLIGGEEVVMAFQTVRDQLIFTNKRIIAVDVQGITGKRKSFSTMPYSKIQYFSIQTPGFAELIPDSELFIMFSNTFTAKFEFKGGVDIGKIGRMISEYVLG